MTISAAPNFVTYVAPGGVAAFNFDKPVFLGTTLKVYTYVPGTDLEPQLVNAGNYTIVVDPDFLGATVTFNAAPAANVKVGIVRVLALAQDLAIGQEDFVSPADLEAALDRMTLMMQQLGNEAFQPVVDDPFGFTAIENVGKPATFDADGKIVAGSGRTVLSGFGPPAAGLGIDGDFYIDAAPNWNIYKKVSGSWGTATSLIGPPGVDFGAAPAFLDLTDTPAAYTGNAGKPVIVNATPNGLEFGTGALGDAAYKNTGTAAGTVAAGDHNHAGVYEPADATILKDADIGVTVQAFDAQLFSNIPQNSKSAAYTLVVADAQKHIFHPSADTTARIWTIPANASVAYPIGTAITFVNQNAAGVITIAITTDTMRLAGAGTTGSRTLAANGVATALKVAATEWIISGTGLT